MAVFAILTMSKNIVHGGIVLVDTSSMTVMEIAQMRAETLERTKAKIDYCLANLGKRFSEVDLQQVGDHDKNVCIITYGLIAEKYYMPYGDSGKAADYYYLEWRDTPDERCAWPEGEYTPFGDAVGLWEQAGRYRELAEHYEEYILDAYSPLKSRDSTKEEKKKELDLNRQNWTRDMDKFYQEDLKKWSKYKKLLKAGKKPKPLDPAVQNHEWFYSDKPGEVLKALSYYYKHKIRFMLEKALGHKDLAVSNNAREYLDKLDKKAAK